MAQSTRSSRASHRLLALISIVALGTTMLIPAVSVSAADPTDMVLDWNLNAVNAIGNLPTATPPGLGQAPPPSTISLAMVQGAVYDAVNAIDGRHEPYLLHVHASS